MPALDTYTSQLVVEVAGSQLPPDIAGQLVRGRVTDGDTLPDACELEFTDPRGVVAEKFAIAAAVRIRVAQNGPGADRALFDGEVTALEREDLGGALHTRVRALDGAARLMRGTRVAAYIDMTIDDVVRKVARAAGLDVGEIAPSGGVIPHLSQDNVSDWTFLSRLARRAGATFTVTGKRLDFGPPTPAQEAPSGGSARSDPVVVEQGANAQYVRAVITAAEQVAKVSVRGWDPQRKHAVVSHADAATDGIRLGEVTPAAIAGKVGSRELLDVDGAGDPSSQARLASSLADRVAGGFAEVEAVVLGNPEIRCGVPVTLTGFGKPFDGRYTVSETTHEFGPVSGYLTTVVVSHTSDRSMFGVASAGAAMRPQQIPGVMTALVTDNDDPDGQGRVKVSFPTLSDDYESGWARTAHVGAGAKRGFVVLPEVGDEVLVAFERGSFDRPVVIAGMFNGSDEPADGFTAHVDGKGVRRRVLTSRSGMKLSLVEDGSAEHLEVSTNSGSQRVTLRQDGEKGIEIVSEGAVSVTAKKDVTVTTDSGHVTLSGAKVTISAKDALELKGAQVSMSGSGKVEVSAPQVSVKADAQAELSSSGIAVVKGSIVKIN